MLSSRFNRLHRIEKKFEWFHTITTFWIIIYFQLFVVAQQQILTPRENDENYYESALRNHRISDTLDRRLTRTIRSSECQMTCRSVKDRPVCASDGRTYASKCQLRRMRVCQKINDLSVVSKGSCPGETKCQEERRRALSEISSTIKSMNDQYIPECKSDGQFNEIQCHNATGYCWCVMGNGKPIPGSSVQGQNIKCLNHTGKHNASINGYNSGVKQRRGLSTKSCISSERATFNTNLIKLFNEEYVRAPKYSRGSDGSVSAVVEWKFGELDLDKDRQLRLKEIRSLRSMVNKLVKPHTCALTFNSYCDRNDDKMIVLHEWVSCLINENDGLKSLDDLNKDKLNKKTNHGSGTGSRFETGSRSLVKDEKVIQRRKIRLDPRRKVTNSKKNADQLEQGGVGTKMPSDTRPVSFLALISSKSTTKTNVNGQQKHTQNSGGRKGGAAGGVKIPTALGQRDHRFVADSRHISAGVRNSCEEERDRARELDKADPNGHIFIPDCDLVTGLYKRAQCHNSTGYCWCVDDQSGLPIPGISTHNITPDCNELKSRRLKGCPFPTKKRFLMELLDHITQQMVERATTINSTVSSHLDEPDPDQSIEERAVRWKLRIMDTNNNSYLERDEIKMFKDEIKNVKEDEKYMRKCRRNFLQYCDEDNNSRISMGEWVECMGLNDQIKSLPENPKRKGPNPFSTVLKS